VRGVLDDRIARVVDAAGADFVLFDMEHTGWSIETIKGSRVVPRQPLHTARARVDARAPSDLASARPRRARRDGADGGVGEDARRIVDLARFPPQGSRGVGVYYPDEIESSGLPDTLEQMNANQFLIAQIETVAGV